MAKDEDPEKKKQMKEPPAQPPAPPPGPPPKRPWLASAISIIIMIVGLLTIVSGGLVLSGGGPVASVPGFAVAEQFRAVIGAVVLLMGIVFLATGFGLWKLKKWALYLVALPLVLYLGILGASVAITGPGIALICAPVPIIAIVLLLYFISIRKKFS